MRIQCRSFGLDQVQLLPGLFKDRFDLNLDYVMSLRSDLVLQDFYLEAGIRENFHGAFGAHRVRKIIRGEKREARQLKSGFVDKSDSRC
jgi:hypothetical protein